MLRAFGRRKRALSLVLVTLAVAFVATLPQAASADAVSDKQAEADRIAAKVEDLNHTIERYAEQANAAQVELDELSQQVAAAQARVDAALAEQAQHQEELKVYAVDAYVHGSDASAATTTPTDDLTQLGQREGYLSAASSSRNQLIDQLRATQEDVKIQIGQLNDAKSAVAVKARDLNARKADASAAQAQQKQLLDQAKGELATLVRQAQQRRAAADASAARARSGSTGGSVGPAPNVRGGAGAAIAEAQRQLGKPYEWGAAGPNAFDCSGLTMWAWRAGGVSLPHYSGAQYSSTTHISMSQIQPGDLIFYEDPGSHVALYVGGGQIIHAPHPGGVVKYDSLYYWNTAMMASRP